jgi:two-component system, NarL family, nitrate/nitrite response regulator NarL
MLRSSSEQTSEARTIRVLMAVGSPLIADAIERVIHQCPRFQLVGQAADGRQALELVRELGPDVAVLGPALGGLDRHRVQRLVRAEGLATRLLYMSDELGKAGAYDLIEDGAAGVLGESTSREELRDAILAVAAGQDVLSTTMVAALTSEIRLRRADDRPVLSPREREILNRFADGETIPTIARAIQVSPSTVKTHVAHLYEKLGVSDRAAAVAEGLRRGLID